jgi:hypothetical protein
MDPDRKSCPSAPCVEGALLLGVKTQSRRLAYIQPPTRVDAEFVEHARAQGHPESRYRFSLPCIESGCPHWTGGGCGIADALVGEPAGRASAAGAPAPAPGTGAERSRLPNCAIRRDCRWFAQHGGRACAVCPLVVADTGGTETIRSLGERGGAARAVHDGPS